MSWVAAFVVGLLAVLDAVVIVAVLRELVAFLRGR